MTGIFTHMAKRPAARAAARRLGYDNGATLWDSWESAIFEANWKYSICRERQEVYKEEDDGRWLVWTEGQEP